MEIKVTCPLGSTCEQAKDGYIERCSWYVQMQGKDAQGKEHNTWNCAIAWQPILQLEVAGTSRNVAASVQSLRNETTKTQRQAINKIHEIEAARNAIQVKAAR